jgi:acetyl esterase/lipase
VRLSSNLLFLGPGRPEALDVYRPTSAAPAGGRPAVVYFHGGGWIRGDKAAPREQAIGRGLASAGYVFVSANYRLGAGAWPGNLEDCRNAVRFLRQHAAEFQVDPERIAAMGASAGGHLALMVAYLPETAPPTASLYAGVSSRVRAVIDFYGITDLLSRETVAPDGTPTGQPNDANSVTVLGVDRRTGKDRWREASPIAHIAPNSPPTLILHGLSDAVVDYGQAIELANALRAVGVPHELVLIEGVGHMFDLETWDGRRMARDLKPAVVAFLDQTLSR